MAFVDTSTFTETDPTSKITLTSTRVTWASIDEGTAAYVYKDYGASYFSTSNDITHYFTAVVGSANNSSGVSHTSYGLSNTANMANNSSVQKMVCRVYRESSTDFRFTNAWWINASNEGQDVAFLGSVADTPIYVTAFYDYSAGSYGSWTISCYSDSSRTTLIDSATSTLTGGRPTSFRYLYAYSYYGAEIGTYVQDGYIEKISIDGDPSEGGATGHTKNMLLLGVA